MAQDAGEVKMDIQERISEAKRMIDEKTNQTSVDYTIYGLLTDVAELLKAQERHPVIVCPHCGRRVV